MSDSTSDTAVSSRWMLVRHAQASFGTANYDALSPRGLQQAQHVATWLVDHADFSFKTAVCGSMQRQRQTLDAITRAFANAHRATPEFIEDAGWNEFAHEEVIRAYAMAHPDDPIVAAAIANKEPRAVHALLSVSLRAWARGELTSGIPESWDAFEMRVAAAVARLQQATRDKALIVSSGGVISRCAQAALGCDAPRAVDLNLSLRNTSISEFLNQGDALRVLTWNTVPHYAASTREWMTYY